MYSDGDGDDAARNTACSPCQHWAPCGCVGLMAVFLVTACLRQLWAWGMATCAGKHINVIWVGSRDGLIIDAICRGREAGVHCGLRAC